MYSLYELSLYIIRYFCLPLYCPFIIIYYVYFISYSLVCQGMRLAK